MHVELSARQVALDGPKRKSGPVIDVDRITELDEEQESVSSYYGNKRFNRIIQTTPMTEAGSRISQSDQHTEVGAFDTQSLLADQEPTNDLFKQMQAFEEDE